MANILTQAEGANVLRCADDDPNMVDLLPQVDAYIRNATGRDWTGDSTIHPVAKAAGRMLLVLWYENPAMISSGMSTLGFGLTAALVQLEALAGRYFTFAGGAGAGAVDLIGARIGDTVSTLVGKIGVTGSQVSSFETVITVDDQIQQVSSSDLSDDWFLAYLIPVSDL